MSLSKKPRTNNNEIIKPEHLLEIVCENIEVLIGRYGNAALAMHDNNYELNVTFRMRDTQGVMLNAGWQFKLILKASYAVQRAWVFERYYCKRTRVQKDIEYIGSLEVRLGGIESFGDITETNIVKENAEQTYNKIKVYLNSAANNNKITEQSLQAYTTVQSI